MRRFIAPFSLTGVSIALLLAGALTQPSIARFTGSATIGANTLTTATSWIYFRAPASAGVASGNLVINKPSGTVTNDTMIASIAVRPNTATITAPGGWTLVRRMDNSNANDNSLAVYRRTAGSSEPSSYTWTLSSNTGAAGGILTFVGVSTSTPVNIENGQNTANALTHTTPSVSTTVADTMLVTSHAFTSAASWAPPGGMAEAVDVASLAVPNTGGISMEINYVFQTASGSTGTKTATASNDADVGNAHMVALRP